LLKKKGKKKETKSDPPFTGLPPGFLNDIWGFGKKKSGPVISEVRGKVGGNRGEGRKGTRVQVAQEVAQKFGHPSEMVRVQSEQLPGIKKQNRGKTRRRCDGGGTTFGNPTWKVPSANAGKKRPILVLNQKNQKTDKIPTGER